MLNDLRDLFFQLQIESKITKIGKKETLEKNYATRYNDPIKSQNCLKRIEHAQKGKREIDRKAVSARDHDRVA